MAKREDGRFLVPTKPFEPHKLLTKRHYRAKEGINGLAITVFWQAISR